MLRASRARWVHVGLLWFILCLGDVDGLIEIVEEQQCHENEFRLTCRDLDSHIAVLEAWYTSAEDYHYNTTHESLRIKTENDSELNKVYVYSSPKHNGVYQPSNHSTLDNSSNVNSTFDFIDLFNDTDNVMLFNETVDMSVDFVNVSGCGLPTFARSYASWREGDKRRRQQSREAAINLRAPVSYRSETAMSPAPPAQRDKTSATHAAVKQSYATSVGKCTYEMERDRIGIWGSGDSTSASKVSGLDRLRHPGLNKGLAFTIEERQTLGIHGLLPARVKSQEEQVQLCKLSIERYEDPLNKYIYLMSLLDRNEHLFYRFVGENVADMMPIVYTPTVGLACQKYGLVYRRPRGLFITIHDKGHIYDILKNWPETDVRAIVVTDGERILGLGDLGACGMGIPVGKLSLYTALAGIKPHQCLPITLDVGTNNPTMLEDPLYIGLRQRRVRGPQYDEFIDEFMDAVVRRYGQNCLIQFEDFGNANAFRLLEKYRGKYCTFNDDIQGTAAVAVAGLLASLRITGKKLCENTIVFQGAGEAALGIAGLCVMAMIAEGCTDEKARSRIWMVDSKGLIVRNRPEGGVNEHKEKFAKDHAPIRTLEEVIDVAKPSVLIGAAAIGGAFTPSILRKMGALNERPVIFALSNPTSKAECTAIDAYSNTDERAIFASGSPFPDYRTKDGRILRPGQGNNSYIFPGLALGIICAGIIDISEDFMLLAAEALAEIVCQADLDQGSLYPPLKDIQDCSVKIAKKIVEHAYQTGKASVFPQPENTEAFIRAQMYDVRYSAAVPPVYTWPRDDMLRVDMI